MKFYDRQARAVDRDRVADVAVAQDRRRVRDDERAPAVVSRDVDDGTEVLNLRTRIARGQNGRLDEEGVIPDL